MMSRFAINCPTDVPSTPMRHIYLVILAIHGCIGLHDTRVVFLATYHGTWLRIQRQLMANLDLGNLQSLEASTKNVEVSSCSIAVQIRGRLLVITC